MDEMLATPFVRKLMSCDEYHNIQTFLHLCANEAYPKKTDPEYNPRKKLAFYLRHCVNLSGKFGVLVNIYPLTKAQFPSFKGRVAFKCYNPSKPDKYHIKWSTVVTIIV